jgi:uncharacterized membrane protein YgcG
LLLSAPAAPAASRSFAIDRFSVTLDVERDGSLQVQETLDVTFRGAHNGIFRLIPLQSTRYGLPFALRIDAVHVLDDDHRPLKTDITYPGRYVKIKAWVPGAVDARRTVHILYRVRRWLLTFEDHDEIYWNVTGTEWDVPIHTADATLTLSSGIDPASLQTAAYTGPFGTAGRDWEEARRPDAITFRTTRTLHAREGLTIAVGWSPGAVPRPSTVRQAGWFVADNWPLGLPLITVVVLALVWLTWGRDPALGRSIKPEYEPPTGLVAAEGGALVAERAEPSDAVATLVDLAVRGYATIEPVGRDDFIVHRTKVLSGDSSLTPLEVFIAKMVFGQDLSLSQRQLSELRRDYDYVFGPIRDEIYRTLVADGFFPASPFWVRQGWGALGVFLLIAGLALFAVDAVASSRYGAALPLGIALSGLIVFGFARIMPRRTRQGVQMLVRVRGFQEFLERAEKDRLERLPGDTLHRWLPWAIALGVTERWIHNFEGLKVDTPTWYASREPFTLAEYHRGVQSFWRQTAEALSTSRRAGGAGGDICSGGSGSSGGGSSGGGMGGGGGGSF